jgi:dynein heavy chain
MKVNSSHTAKKSEKYCWLTFVFALFDVAFIQVVGGIKRSLATAFENAYTYAKNFEPYKEIFFVNNATDVQQSKDCNIEQLTDVSFSLTVVLPSCLLCFSVRSILFIQLINQYERQVTDFEQIPTTANIGIVQVDSAALKQQLLPAPKRCLEELQDLLPNVAREKTQLLLDEIVSANNKISTIPASVEEFVEIMSFLTKTKANLDVSCIVCGSVSLLLLTDTFFLLFKKNE